MTRHNRTMAIIKTYRFDDPDQKGHVIYSYVPEPMNNHPLKLVRVKIYGRGKAGSQLYDELEIQCGILSELLKTNKDHVTLLKKLWNDMPIARGKPKTIMGYVLKDLNRSYIV
tara:strand:- start:1095 stop:1433 length:339 start_codon:yes stop_codon:yes gene_type:complete